jgi:acetyltransferase-like isoleucine patch superfamily enzyme
MSTARFHFAQFLLRLIPLTRGFGIKRSILRWCGVQVGSCVSFSSTVRFFCKGPVIIGAGTWIGTDALFIGGEATIEIGRDCDVAPQVTFVTGTHQLGIGEDKAAGPGESRPIYVGDGSWIGARATLLGGTNIGECTIVAAGSVVKGDFPPRSLIGGVPARIIRDLSAEASTAERSAGLE